MRAEGDFGGTKVPPGMGLVSTQAKEFSLIRDTSAMHLSHLGTHVTDE